MRALLALRRAVSAALLAAPALAAAPAPVVISEILYHPDEEDELDEFVELWNGGSAAIEIGGWKLAGGAAFELPAGTRLEVDARLVVARDLDRFQSLHGKEPRVVGPFRGELKNGGEELQLLDAKGAVVDAVAYSSSPPWPQGADGNGSSLERLSPDSPARDAHCWAPSPPPPERDGPPGSPGRAGATWFAHLPPLIELVDWSPRAPKPGEAVRVEAVVRHAGPIAAVELAYTVAKEGSESAETRAPMERVPQRDGRFAATIPGQEASRLIRFRVVARDDAGAERSSPSPHDLRPTYSLFVAPQAAASKIPHAYLIHVNAEEMALTQGRGSPAAGDVRGLGQERQRLERKLNLAPVWSLFFGDDKVGMDRLTKLREVLREEAGARQQTIEAVLKSQELAEKASQGYTEEIAAADARLEKTLQPVLTTQQVKRALAARKDAARSRSGGFGIEPFVKEAIGLDALGYFVGTQATLEPGKLEEARRAFVALKAEEKRAVDKVVKAMGAGEDPMSAMGDTMTSLPGKAVRELQQALGAEDRVKFARWRARNVQSPFGPGRGAPQQELPPRGNTAFCLVSPEGQVEVFDHVQAPMRAGGFKVRFHGDRPLRLADPFAGKEAQVRTANLIHEYQSRFILAEPLAYALYRRCGVPAPASGHVRLSVDGQLQGHHLVVEQPNRSFLRRHGRDDRGNLYKILWYGREVVEQHEKKTNTAAGHEDLVELLEALDKVSGDEQWKLIESRFNLDETIGYFAASLCLSNWDGFFNNYFAYHDLKGTGKWEIYPWDEDKTWGFYDGLPPGEVFIDMPTDFGADGAAPPGGEPQGGPGNRGQFRGFIGGASWWRPPGYFSGPVLANPVVRARYLKRVREIVDTIYTEEIFLPIIAAMEERLLPEVRARAEALGLDTASEEETFRLDMESLRRHLRERRKFLLEQKEMRG